jgi:hypothetical protein
VHGIVAAVGQVTGGVREHLVDQEPHDLRGHEVVAPAPSAPSAVPPRVGGHLGVDVVAVDGGVVDRDADVAWVQIELLGEHAHALLVRPSGVAQGGDDLPDVGSDRERGAAPGRPIAKHDAGVVEGVQSLGDKPFEQATLGGVLRGRLGFQPRLDRRVDPVRRGSGFNGRPRLGRLVRGLPRSGAEEGSEPIWRRWCWCTADGAAASPGTS